MKQYCNVARYKNQIFVRELVEGLEQRRKVKFRPSLFQSTNEKTEWQNFYGDGYVERRTFDSPFEMKNFIEENKSTPNEVWGNTDIVSQFIYEGGYDTTDAQNIKVSYLDIEVCTRELINGEWIDGGFPNAEDANFPINAICDYRPYKKKYYVFTTAKGWTHKKSQLKYSDEVEYIYCPSEEVLIDRWLRFWEYDTPHINSGWNNKSFDIPYIINRMKRLNGEEYANRISPWRVLTEKKSVGKFGQTITSYEILGVGIVDYLDLYQKYRYVPREKYTLDYISRCELPDEHKLEFKGTHGSLYYDDPVFFVDYNVQDVRCVVKFEEKLQFMNLIIFLSYYSGINFEENFSPIKIWETLIYRTAADKGIVIPMKPENVTKEPYEGAYVHDPIPGLKGTIASFDFTSLYPSLMRLYYIAPDVHQTGQKKTKLYNGLMDVLKSDGGKEATEMFREIMETGIFNNYYVNNDIPKSVTKFLQDNKVSLATNCEFYNIERESIFIRLIADLFAGRKSDKKQSFNYKHKAQDIEQELEKRGTFPEYANLSVEELEIQHKEAKHLANVYDVSQLVKKILLNSLYGAVGNNYFRYYNRDMARSITLAGQMYINKAAVEKNQYIANCLHESEIKDRRLYGDTDSNYFDLSDVLNKFYEMKPDADRNTATDFIDRFCKKIESDCLQPLFDKMKVESNCHPDGVMHMDREAICIPYKKTGHSAIWTAKKRYIAMVSDMEGFRYEEPHRKIMGLFSVTSSCPEFIKPVYNRVLEELISEGVETARKSITNFKKDFYKKTVEEISFPKSVSDVLKYTNPKTGLSWEGKWFDSSTGKERNGGVPVNSKAAINHNYLIKKLGLEKKYQLIKDGDKIKFAWLKENPYGFSVVAFKEDFPEEFGLKQFVSYDLHWEKLFYSPMNDIFSACGLSVENVLSIEDFF